MNFLRRFSINIIGFLLLIFAGSSLAEPIIIYGNHNKPPKNFLKEGKAEGILIDIMQYVDRHMPDSFEYQLFPWNRAYTNAANGNGGIIGLSMSRSRLEIFDYSDVMYYEDLMLVVLKGNEFSYTDVNDLHGKRVGFQRGASFGDEFERGKDQIFQSAEDDGIKQRLVKLLNGRIDVAIIGPGIDGFKYAVAKSTELIKRKDEFTTLPTPFKRDPNYLGFAKSMEMKPFLEQFNVILKQGYSDGVLQDIMKPVTGD